MDAVACSAMTQTDRQAVLRKWCVAACVVYILVTEYNDKYTRTRVHEVLEACKQLSRKETFLIYTHPLTAPNGHNTVLVVIPTHVCTESTTMKHNPTPTHTYRTTNSCTGLGVHCNCKVYLLFM